MKHLKINCAKIFKIIRPSYKSIPGRLGKKKKHRLALPELVFMYLLYLNLFLAGQIII